MADTFDPYHKWLGIPEDQRPATHYQLLGISPDEHDQAVIAAAVARVSAYIRNFSASRHSQEAARILQEITAAQACLLDPGRRAVYDAALRRKQAQSPPRRMPNLTEPFREAQRARLVQAAPSVPPPSPGKKLDPSLERLFASQRPLEAPARVSGRLGRQSLRKLPSMQVRRKRSFAPWGAAAGVVAALSLAAIALALLSDRGQASRARNEPSPTPGESRQLAQNGTLKQDKPSEPTFEGPDFTALMPEKPAQPPAEQAGADAEKSAREEPSSTRSDPASASSNGRGALKARTAERVRALSSGDAHSRWLAARALRDMGSQAADGVRSLVAALEDGDTDVAAMAAEALGAIGPVNDDVVPALAKALEHP
ncbi:MAG: HEAT repeat domain-containing protein, partial [Pirellulales bacterium]